MPTELRLDELAQASGVATTTIRLYQHKGLLHGPRLVGRTGFYDESHRSRLELIRRLQEQGFSLAGIGRLLETWQHGRDLTDLVGAEVQLDALLRPAHAVELSAEELLARFPEGALQPQHVQRAAALGLVEATDDGRFRVPDARFLDSGAALLRLGVPADVVLDEWQELSKLTDKMAKRFVRLFEAHLLPAGWRSLEGAAIADLAATLRQLRATANEVVAAALDASVLREGSTRLGDLMGDPTDA